MRIRFWGTRGSIAKPGKSTLRHGGNTSCVEVRTADGTLLVLDCGTGAHALGKELGQTGEGRVGHLLIGHTHWDHIQGFGFFQPLFAPTNEWHVYAPAGGQHPKRAIGDQLTYEYSPISIESLRAELSFHSLAEGVFDAGGARIRTQLLHHPALTLAYRIEADGACLVYATDHEPHSLHPVAAPPGSEPIHREDLRHLRFLQGADLVIHDGQYILDEFPSKSGWGHSPVERIVDYALLAGVPRLVFTHHDPDRTDAEIEAIEAMARERASLGRQHLEVHAAAEGQSFEVAGSRATTRPPIAPEDSALLTEAPTQAGSVLIVDDDRDLVRVLQSALRAEGMRVLTAGDASSALAAARGDAPSLILLDMNLPDAGGLDVCRTLRGELDPKLRDVPIVILTGARLKESDLVEAFVAGATDYLTKPIKPTLVRSRVRGWLLRRAAGGP
jgi:CheY-like chemotaxis protein/glyoxylase-like metal-dependent hydrolase (beta-lactamase superfamily II)